MSPYILTMNKFNYRCLKLSKKESERTTLNLDRQTFNYLKILSNQTRIIKSELLKQYIEAMAQLSANFQTGNCGFFFNLVGDDKIEIQFFGKKTIQHGIIRDVKDEQSDSELLKKEGVN